MATGQLLAHDFWLEAPSFYTEPGKTVDLSVYVGNEYVGESLPNIRSWYSDFSIYDKQSKRPVEGDLGRDPAGYFSTDREGTYAVGYQSDWTYIEIETKIFNKYLHEEGLDHAIEFRRQHGLSEQPGKEDYIRHAKILVQSGEGFDVDNAQVKMGYELEIIPRQNPYQLSQGDKLEFQILYQGKPADDLLLIAFSKNHPERLQKFRTGADGLAHITLDDNGPWLVKAVKILRLQKQKANWQSHWASLTFALR